MDVWQVHATGDSLEIHTTGTASEVAALSCNDPLAVVDPVPFVDPDNTVVNGQMICREVLKPGDRLVWLASPCGEVVQRDRKSTRLNSSHVKISYAVFCLKKKR